MSAKKYFSIRDSTGIRKDKTMTCRVIVLCCWVTHKLQHIDIKTREAKMDFDPPESQ